MNNHNVHAAAKLLADLRLRENAQTNALDDLPSDLRPGTLVEAYDVQAQLAEELSSREMGPVVGWKVGCTTSVMQDYLNIDHPCAGRLYAPTVFRHEARLEHGRYFRLGLECEIAVRLGRDLSAMDGAPSLETCIAAVENVMTSIEIVDERFKDFRNASVASLTADDFFSVGCILGEAKPIEAMGDLAQLQGGFSIDGAEPETSGVGAAILGHPLNALSWLAGHAASRGTHLAAGTIVTLGSVVRTIYPEPGRTIEARFDGLSPARAIVT